MESALRHQDTRQLVRDTDEAQRGLGEMRNERVAWARHREKVIREILGSLQRAFVNLDILYDDLKKAKTELNGEYVLLKDLRRLEVDLSRLRKSIKQIKKHLRS